MKIYLVGLGLLFLTCCKSSSNKNEEKLASTGKKPNILFLSIDDLRPELGYYGNKEIHTPNFDAFAKSSSVMLNAYCQVAVCAPSRASALLGYRPDSTRVWHLGDEFRKINPEAVTMPQYFHKAGYYTVNIGKIFHNFMPDSVSWDEPDLRPAPYNTEKYRYRDPESYWYTEASIAIQTKVHDSLVKKVDNEHQLYSDGWNRGPAIESADLPDSVYYDAMQTRLALQTLKRIKDKDQPFFLGLGWYRPHLPFVVPKKYWDMYPAGSVSPSPIPKLPEGAPVMAANANYELRFYDNAEYTIRRPEEEPLPEQYADTLKRGYYASVSYVDALLGNLVKGLKDMGLYDNTIIVIWGDHGWKLGDHNGWGKQTNFYIDTHVPLIVKAPGQEKGQRIEGLTELVDMFPTICDLAGVKKAAYFQGTSMAPLFQNPDREWKEAVFSQFRRRPRISYDGKEYMGYSMQTEKYHYIEWYHWDNTKKEKGDYAAAELYDHRHTDLETKNVIDDPQYKEVVKKLAEELKAGWKTAKPKI